MANAELPKRKLFFLCPQHKDSNLVPESTDRVTGIGAKLIHNIQNDTALELVQYEFYIFPFLVRD